MRQIVYTIIACCLIYSQAFAFGLMLGKGNTVVSGGDCPSGTYEIGYNGDHSSGADYVCYESGTASEQGTTVNATVSSSYVSFSSANDYLEFTITGDISAGLDTSGAIYFSLNMASVAGVNAILELSYGGSTSEIITARFDGTKIRFDNEGGGQNQNINSTVVSAASTNYRCAYQWDATNDIHECKCVTSGSVTWTSPDDSDSEAIDEWDDADGAGSAVDPDTLTIGEHFSAFSVTGEVRVWDVFVVSGWDSTDPGSL